MRNFFYYVVVNILILSACTPSQGNLEQDIPVTDQKTDISSKVTTIYLKRKPFNYFIQCAGKIRPLRQQTVSALVGGMVVYDNLHNGHNVSSGQLLMAFESKKLKGQLTIAEQNLFNSKLTYESEILSQEGLLEGKRKGIRDTVLRKLSIASGLLSARNDVEQLKTDLGNTMVKAPFFGKLANVRVKSGEVAKVGQELFTVFTANEMLLEGNILELDFSNVSIGQSATITPVASGKEYKAVVTELNPSVSEDGLITLKIRISHPEGLLPGMNATAVIDVPKSKSLSVPKSAIVNHNDRPVVFTVVNNLAKWNYVVVGRDNGKDVEIVKGLKEGDEIIINKNVQLVDNSPVQRQQ